MLHQFSKSLFTFEISTNKHLLKAQKRCNFNKNYDALQSKVFFNLAKNVDKDIF